VTVGQTVRLVSRSQGEIEKALWDFDDGIPAVGHKVTHLYKRAGDYRITVVVWDRFGRAARCSKRLKVVSGPGGRAISAPATPKSRTSLALVNIILDALRQYCDNSPGYGSLNDPLALLMHILG